MKWFVIALALLATPACAGVRLADADPAPGEETWIEDNRVTLTFGEAVIPVKIDVIDALGRYVSTGNIEGTAWDVEALMRAPEREGYVCGTMTVVWHVKVKEDGREARGMYNFTIRAHNNMVCAHQYKSGDAPRK